MSNNRHKLWMDIAERVSQESYCIRHKVGAIAVKDHKVISIGWNGTFSGHDNCCETYEVIEQSEAGPDTVEKDGKHFKLVTKREVIHAESNMLGKLAGSYESARDASVYVTLSPCIECAKQLAIAGVKEVVYLDEYRDSTAIEYLNRCGVRTEKFTPKESK